MGPPTIPILSDFTFSARVSVIGQSPPVCSKTRALPASFAVSESCLELFPSASPLAIIQLDDHFYEPLLRLSLKL